MGLKYASFDNIVKGILMGTGVPLPGFGKVHVCAKGSGNPTWDFLNEILYPDEWRHKTITAAKASTEDGRNDVVLLSPDSHTQTAQIDWSNNITHLIGMYPEAYQNQRARIGHSAALANMLTVSGYGNLFANLYFMYGIDDAASLNLLTVSGNRNTFKNTHFLAGGDGTELDQAGYDLVRLNAAETLFDRCFFGSDSVPWTNGNMIEFGAAAEPPRSVFKDCLFVMNADNAQVTFLKVLAGAGACTMIFQNCLFFNIGTSLTYAIDGTGLGNAKMLFDINCTFAGVDDIVVVGEEANVWWGHGGYVSADLLNNMLATNPDVS